MSYLPGLLRLPGELRDGIYDYLLHNHEDPPSCPENAGTRIPLQNTIRLKGVYACCPWWNSPLARTNHQLRAETLEHMSEFRSSAPPQTAELDMIFEHYVSWPTWKYFSPQITRGFSFDLNVYVRIFSTETFKDYDGVRNFDGWFRGHISAPFLDLVVLLKRLVRHGPSFQQEPLSNNTTLDRQNGSQLPMPFKVGRLWVGITYHNDAGRLRSNNSSFVKGLRHLLFRSGIARGLIETIEVDAENRQVLPEFRGRRPRYHVNPDVREGSMQRCIEFGLCRSVTDTLATAPLENGEPVLRSLDEWECG